MALADSNSAIDKHNQQKTAKDIYTFKKSIFSWTLKLQRQTNLFSTEARHIAILSATQEITFADNFLNDTKKALNSGIGDNKGAFPVVETDNL